MGGFSSGAVTSAFRYFRGRKRRSPHSYLWHLLCLYFFSLGCRIYNRPKHIDQIVIIFVRLAAKRDIGCCTPEFFAKVVAQLGLVLERCVLWARFFPMRARVVATVETRLGPCDAVTFRRGRVLLCLLTNTTTVRSSSANNLVLGKLIWVGFSGEGGYIHWV